jgi:hypothetical protein
LSSSDFYKLRKIAKSAVINVANLLSLSRKTVEFWKFNFAHNMMNDLRLKIKLDQLCINEELFQCKKVLLLGNCHGELM